MLQLAKAKYHIIFGYIEKVKLTNVYVVIFIQSKFLFFDAIKTFYLNSVRDDIN